MKKLTLFTLLFVSVITFGQEDSSEIESTQSSRNKNHEIKLGVIKALAGPFLDIEYEYNLNKYSSVGGNLGINLNDDDFIYDASLSSFYRMYFTEGKEYGTKGFYAQGFLGYYTGDSNVFNLEETKFNTFALGFGVGRKWTNKQGFVFQAGIGVGRTLGGGQSTPSAIVQGDLYIGYRF